MHFSYNNLAFVLKPVVISWSCNDCIHIKDLPALNACSNYLLYFEAKISMGQAPACEYTCIPGKYTIWFHWFKALCSEVQKMHSLQVEAGKLYSLSAIINYEQHYLGEQWSN